MLYVVAVLLKATKSSSVLTLTKRFAKYYLRFYYRLNLHLNGTLIIIYKPTDFNLQTLRFEMRTCKDSIY